MPQTLRAWRSISDKDWQAIPSLSLREMVSQHTVTWREPLSLKKGTFPVLLPLAISPLCLLLSSNSCHPLHACLLGVWFQPDIVACTEKAFSLFKGRGRLTSAEGAITEPPGRWRYPVVPLMPRLRGEAGLLNLNLTGPRCPGEISKEQTSRCVWEGHPRQDKLNGEGVPALNVASRIHRLKAQMQ